MGEKGLRIFPPATDGFTSPGVSVKIFGRAVLAGYDEASPAGDPENIWALWADSYNNLNQNPGGQLGQSRERLAIADSLTIEADWHHSCIII
jgi:hypothetical protein